MKDVAHHAGVSVATVSNVLTGKQVVSKQKKEKVLASMKELNYNINLLARSLKTQKTNTIGVILPDVTKLFFLDVLRGIMETAVSEKYQITIFSSNYDFALEKILVQYLYSSRVDGIILDTCAEMGMAAEWAQELFNTGSVYVPPVVSLECKMNEEYVSSITLDCQYWSGQITQHLVDGGRRHILYISGPDYLEHEYYHLEGYKEVLRRNNLPIQEELISRGNFLSGTAYDTVRAILTQGIHFDAIQASNDQAAIGAIKALIENGVPVPGQIAVCGFDDLFPATLIKPAVTTVSVPRYRMGVLAVQEILRRIQEPNAPPVCQVLDAELMIRASSSPKIKTAWNLESW